MHFDGFCESVECPCFKVWSEDHSISDHGRHYESIIECAACTKNPEADCIHVVPHDCLHLTAIVDYHVDYRIKEAQLIKELDQEEMWERLWRV